MRHQLILCLVCFTAILFAQEPNWTSVKETNINFGSNVSYDLFTNSYGNNIIIQESNALKYYKMDIYGQASTPVTLESSAVVSPSISGDATRIYVVYRKSSENFIRAKYSLDGGTTWYSRFSLTQNGTNIESVISKGNLHVTYQISNSIYYNSIPLVGGNWSSRYTVSDTETGQYPRIATWSQGSADEVWFIYKYSNTVGKFRKYNVASGQWDLIRTGYTLNSYNLYSSAPAGFTIGSDYLYYYYTYTDNNFMTYFGWFILDRDGNYIDQSAPDVNQTYRVFNTTTKNGNSYTTFYYLFTAGRDHEPGIYRQKNVGTEYYELEQVYYNNNQNPVYDPPVNISSAGNDVHIIWKDNLGNNNGNNLRYIYDDQAPFAPQNLQIDRNANNHPYLNWSANTEPDLHKYIIQKESGQGWQYLAETTNLYYEDATETYCTAPPPQQCQDGHTVSYHIRAVDINSHQSDPSNDVRAYVNGGQPEKGVSDNFQVSYKLDQNYPNPFNPSTSISYSLEKDGFVTLKVFDMLGREVAELVNENQYAGSYNLEFNAINLPSGIYIYQLQSGNFSDMKKMLLIK